MFIDGETGVLHTTHGDYEFFFGEEKVATHTHGASCKPVGDPQGRAQVHVRWSPEVGRRLMAVLRRKLETNAAQASRTGYFSPRQ